MQGLWNLSHEPTEERIEDMPIDESIETRIPHEDAKNKVHLSQFLKEVKQKNSQDNVRRKKFGQNNEQHEKDPQKLHRQDRKKRILIEVGQSDQKLRRRKQISIQSTNKTQPEPLETINLEEEYNTQTKVSEEPLTRLTHEVDFVQQQVYENFENLVERAQKKVSLHEEIEFHEELLQNSPKISPKTNVTFETDKKFLTLSNRIYMG